jgi:hypothetical protein
MNAMTESEITLEETSLKDRLGIIASCICAIHCLATPLLTLAWPFIATHTAHEWIHIGLLLFVAPLALFAFSTQRKKHGSNVPFAFGISGLAFLAAGVIFHDLAHDHFALYVAINVIGSSLLIYGHYKNIKLCQCNTCHN